MGGVNAFYFVFYPGLELTCLQSDGDVCFQGGDRRSCQESKGRKHYRFTRSRLVDIANPDVINGPEALQKVKANASFTRWQLEREMLDGVEQYALRHISIFAAPAGIFEIRCMQPRRPLKLITKTQGHAYLPY